MKKRIVAAVISASMIMSLGACAVSTDTGDTTSKSETEKEENLEGKEYSGESIEVAVRYSGTILDEFNGIVDRFENESGCKVEVTSYGMDDYENSLKTRMASNTLPDVFETHGWSILRYKEYLTDLSGESWVSQYDESALGVIQDENGEIYVCMPTLMPNGILVNLEVCEDAGVDVYGLNTWEDFSEACKKIKDAGYTPIGQAPGPGNIANVAGTWASYEGELAEDSDAMLDGTYDFESMVPWLEMYAEWLEKGYLFDDYATIKSEDATQRFASNKSAFWIGNDAQFFLGCLQLNPEGKYAIVPAFASKEGGKRFVGIGEGDAFGIWKDTEHADAAKAFLTFLAKPENAAELAENTGFVSCMKESMQIDEGIALQYFNDMKEKFAETDILYENLWDRKYMPSGMWPVFKQSLDVLIADPSAEGVQDAKGILLENYKDLYEAAQSE